MVTILEATKTAAKAKTDAAHGRLRSYHARGDLDRGKAAAYLDEVAENRADRGCNR